MSNLTITGKLLTILPVEKGTSKAGKEWEKQSFIIDTGAQFNPEVCFSLFGTEKIAILSEFKTGQEIEVSFNVSSREFNNKYYHNLDAWRITSSQNANTGTATTTEEEIDPPF